MPRALITGVTGQDGYHLTELLTSLDYEIFGLVNGQKNPLELDFSSRFPKVTLIKGDLTDFSSILTAVKFSNPDEIYNLGAISFVGLSFHQPELTADVTGLGLLRVMEAVRQAGLSENTKIYQASSSEMFGKVREIPQTEMTPFHPRSPYGVAKTFAHFSAVNYREAYGMQVYCGILFNHEGPYRGKEFVTRKISLNVARIKLGLIDNFELGSLSPRRDWGYAGDYVKAMHSMLQHNECEDFVIATGVVHSVREFVEAAIVAADLPGAVEDYVKFNDGLLRPSEVDLLVGDSSKAKSKLGWQADTTFEELVGLMVENDLRILYGQR